MSKAAGLLLVSNNGNALFLRRTETAPDFPGHWDFPGGGQEGASESAELTAIPETREEIGFLPDGKRFLHTRTASPMSYGVGVGTARGWSYALFHRSRPIPLPLRRLHRL